MDLSQFGQIDRWFPDNGRLGLGPGTPQPNFSSELAEIGRELQTANTDDFTWCILSAAWLFQDCLDESHTISQSIHSSTGSYLHGIMHRREGDFSNAKYWFRKAGPMDFFPELERQIRIDNGISSETRGKLGADFSPFEMVDAVSACLLDESAGKTNCLERISFLELTVLTQFCIDRTEHFKNKSP